MMFCNLRTATRLISERSGRSNLIARLVRADSVDTVLSNTSSLARVISKLRLVSAVKQASGANPWGDDSLLQ